MDIPKTGIGQGGTTYTLTQDNSDGDSSGSGVEAVYPQPKLTAQQYNQASATFIADRIVNTSSETYDANHRGCENSSKVQKRPLTDDSDTESQRCKVMKSADTIISKELAHNRHKYARLARQWLSYDPIYLDTETTGLNKNAEVVEISIIDSSGKILLDTLVKPAKPIPREAIDIHGITNEMVENAPAWAEIHDDFLKVIKDRTLLIYNADYDKRVILQSSGLDRFDSQCSRIGCVMKLFAAYYGEWNHYLEDWKYQKLTAAADYMGVKVEGQAHRALADCRMTLGILKTMAATTEPVDIPPALKRVSQNLAKSGHLR